MKLKIPSRNQTTQTEHTNYYEQPNLGQIHLEGMVNGLTILGECR